MISALEGLMIVWGGARKSDMHDLFGVEKDKDTNASPIIVSKCHASSSPMGIPKLW